MGSWQEEYHKPASNTACHRTLTEWSSAERSGCPSAPACAVDDLCVQEGVEGEWVSRAERMPL